MPCTAAISRRSARLSLVLFCLGGILPALRSHPAAAADPPAAADLLSRDNLVAWCVVPFDAQRRGPAERAEMLKRLGFTKLAYDWREEHVPTFEEEILQLQKHGIQLFAFWSTHEEAFRLFEKHGLHPQIWVTAPSPAGDTDAARVAAAARELLPLVERTRRLGCPLGLYNHGGWGGEPQNLVAVCRQLREATAADHVGIVYNWHHGHEHIADWPAALAAMQPYLLCLNLNGMNDGEKPKILTLGGGQHEQQMLETVLDSSYRGPLGIIDHRPETDSEATLQENLAGLRQLTGAGPNWEQLPGQSLGLKLDGRLLWQLHYGPDQPKPYFHPVALPGGPVLTWNRPPDHVWHHGLWFSWKFINGLNYWEPDPQTGKPAGATECTVVRLDTRPDGSAELVLDLVYRPRGGPMVMTERRTIAISAPDAQRSYHFDWTCSFTAGDQDVQLDRTPLEGEPGGQPWGGYAGLSIRLAEGFRDAAASTTEGPVEFDRTGRFRGRAQALDYHGSVEGQAVGIAVCDHPQNLNHPTPWYVIRALPMSYFSPAVLCYEPHILPAGQKLTLRYRVLVHPQAWDANRLRAEYERFVGGTAGSPLTP